MKLKPLYDLVIRNGTVVDGTGREPIEADVAVSAGRIAEISKVTGQGREEIDARGLIVTPGFVDIHTHFDGQVTWENRLVPSDAHGVTTVVMGNCGVGFAPCREADRRRLIELMEGVEDIPEVVMTEGIPWNWETFPQYLDALESRSFDADIATQVPHAPLRVYAMGERGAAREPATEADLQLMARLAREGIEAGALGFATSRTINHRTSKGEPTFTRDAAEQELQAIAAAVGATGHGVLQMVCDFYDNDNIEREFGLLRRLAARSGRPLSVSMSQLHENPDGWELILKLLGEANAQGLRLRGQVVPRPVGGFLGLELSIHPFSFCCSYRAIARLPLAERVRALREPSLRARLVTETPTIESPLRGLACYFEEMYPVRDSFNYEPDPQSSLGRTARRLGTSPQALAYDMLLENEGRGMLYVPLANYARHTLEPCLTQMLNPNTVMGLGDAGAHLGMICDGSFPTFMLTYWVRDRRHGGQLSLPWVVRALTQDTASTVGLNDRGVLAPGFKADINMIDLANLQCHLPEVVHDLPAGGRRLVQGASGYVATFVNGIRTFDNGVPTGLLPGRLVRGARLS